MLNDIITIVWKEWKELIARSSRTRSETLKTVGVLAVILGIVVWRGSFLMGNLATLLVPSFVLVQLLGGLMADSFAGERERHTLETLLASRLSDLAILIGKIVSGVVLVWGLMVIALGLSLAAAYVRNPGFQMQTSMTTLGVILLIYLLVCLVMSCSAVLVSLRAPTVRQAIQTLSWSVMIVFFLAIFIGARLSPEWRTSLLRALGEHFVRFELIVIGGLAAVAGILFAIARVRFRRDMLILD